MAAGWSFRISIPPEPKRKFVPFIKLWKLRDPEKQAELSEVFKAKASGLSQTSTVDDCWTSLKDKLLFASKQVCEASLNHPLRKQTWWWNKQVEEADKEKRTEGRGGSRAAYNTAKRASNRVQFTRPRVRLRRLLFRK